VHLTDPPFLVVTLADIEVASLERVQFTLKQFDMVLVLKDFTKAPLHINSIPSTQLDDVKNWLEYVSFPSDGVGRLADAGSAVSSVDIALSEGPVNLNWAPIMKTINESPYDFFQQGGWSFLGGAGKGEEVRVPFLFLDWSADIESQPRARAQSPPLLNQSLRPNGKQRRRKAVMRKVPTMGAVPATKVGVTLEVGKTMTMTVKQVRQASVGRAGLR
jgi:hypothetical protein